MVLAKIRKAIRPSNINKNLRIELNGKNSEQLILTNISESVFDDKFNSNKCFYSIIVFKNQIIYLNI